MNSPRICIISYSPGYGGISSAQLSLLSYWENKYPVLFIDETPQYSMQWLNKQELKTVTQEALPVWTKRSDSNPIINKITDFKPDIVFVTNIALMVFHGFALRNYCNKSGVKIKTIIHSGMLNFSFQRFLLEFAETFALMLADERIYVSNFTKRRWENRYVWLKLFGKSKVSFNSIHPMPEICQRNKPDIVRIGFVGSIEPVKRPDLFCRIARKSIDMGCKYQFILIGNGKLYLKLKRKYSTCVNFVNNLKDQKIIYDQIDILVVTSKVENCSMAIMEAQVRGIPVIAPAVGGNPEIIENRKTGVLLKKATPQHFLKEIEYVVKNYELVSAFSLDRQKEYSAKKLSNQLID